MTTKTTTTTIYTNSSLFPSKIVQHCIFNAAEKTLPRVASSGSREVSPALIVDAVDNVVVVSIPS